MTQTLALPKTKTVSPALIAWPVMLLISLLPDILFKELTGSLPPWLFWVKNALLAAAFLAGLVWKPLGSLRLFFSAVLALHLLQWGADRLLNALHYQRWLAGAAPFIQDVGSVQIARVLSAVAMVLVMLVLLGSPRRFFLVKGDLNARAEPIPLLLTRPPAWNLLGPAIAGAMCLGLTVFIFVLGRPPALSGFSRVVPLLPFVLLFAAANAFGEEMLYRAPWLAVLETPIGPAHALLLTAVYFGIGHFYGVPYGILGCVMAFIPGWLMGKAMLETRGFLWPWFIHFCMDAVIFFAIALGSVTPGG